MQGILAQKFYDACTVFCQFSDIKNGDDSSSQASSVTWFPVGPSTMELAVLRKANLIFQWISLYNATLLTIVFFACGVTSLITVEKVELKENYTKWS